MVRIPDRENTSRICVTVLTEYRCVTDGWTDGRTDILPRHSPRYAYASRGKKNDQHVHKFKLILVGVKFARNIKSDV